MPVEFCLCNRRITGEDPAAGRSCSTWIQSVSIDLSSFGTELPEAREPTFLADVNEARHYALIVVHAHIGLDTSAFSALTLLVGHQEEHMALWPVKNCMMRCWCGCLEVQMICIWSN